jgi:hypothetical protein
MAEMTEAPERIWIEDERPEGGSCHVYDDPTPGVLKYAVEYIRKDVVQDLIDTIRRGQNEERFASLLLQKTAWK